MVIDRSSCGVVTWYGDCGSCKRNYLGLGLLSLLSLLCPVHHQLKVLSFIGELVNISIQDF